ncbi:TPA: hypothetical protein I8Y21_002019 [Klebsiella oxytoca]|uniref:Uncharacterized protein n=1 Tax=Klebsiella oxytoca TaxID=571 RepID=A0AAN5L6T3_KLEOX|nr:hypothetical protein [Klebsiella oxytoca]
MSNKVQVIFTAECETKDVRSVMGMELIPTTVSVYVDSEGLEKNDNSPEQLFGRILMEHAPVITRVIQEQVYDVMQKNGSVIINKKTTEITTNKEQTH